MANPPAKHPGIQRVGLRDKPICMCIYGNPGVGKTRLIGTGGKRTLILRPPTDHTESIRQPANDMPEEWVMRDHHDMAEAQEFMRHGGGAHYDWVWFDSFTLWQDHGMDDIFEEVVAEKPHRAKHGWDKGEYGTNNGRLGTWIRHMVGDLSFHFGFVAHADSVDDMVKPGEVLLGPAIQGKRMPQKMAGYTTITGYYELAETKQGPKRILRTQLSPNYFAKDQYDAFDNGRLIDPTMPKIMAAIGDKAKVIGAETTSRKTPRGKARRTVRRGKSTSRR